MFLTKIAPVLSICIHFCYFLSTSYGQVGIKGQFHNLLFDGKFDFDNFLAKEASIPAAGGGLSTGKALYRLPYMDNYELLQEEIGKNSIIAAAGCDNQFIYLKGTGGNDELNRSVNSGSFLQTAENFNGTAKRIIIPGPFTFGKKVTVDIDCRKDGLWAENGSHRIWRLVLQSTNAYSLSLLFDQFRLPEGSELYVHDADRRLTLGAFTAAVNNKDDMKFATAPLPGNAVVLEYFEPLNTPTNILKLHIMGVVHAFRDLFLQPKTGLCASDGASSSSTLEESDSCMAEKRFAGISGNCNFDVSCPLGNGWTDQINSVVVFMTAEGQKFCSGAMINNAIQDGKQYFLTANHCVDDPNTDYRYSILGFNYQAASCGSSALKMPVAQAAHGLLLRAKFRDSDFALFELQEVIPDAYNAFLAGWSAVATVPAGTLAGIHHPSGDTKKISSANVLLTPDCWTECPRQLHWRVNHWSKGVTEPGSSGSPLFSSQGLIIGQLHGGGSSCDNPLGYDVYGAMQASYNSGMDSTQRLIDWLNPRADPNIISIPGAYLNNLRAKTLISHMSALETKAAPAA